MEAFVVLGCCRMAEGLFDIFDNINNIFNPHRKANIARINSCGQLVLRGELGMCCRSRMDGQCADIANISHMIDKFEIVDKSTPCFESHGAVGCLASFSSSGALTRPSTPTSASPTATLSS